MKKYHYAKCLRDIVENGVILFEKGCTYRVAEFDFRSLLYYIEVPSREGFTDEFAVAPNHPDFVFLTKEDQRER